MPRRQLQARTLLQLGSGITKGLGGCLPDVGRQAAIEDRERIAEVLGGADMVVHHRRHGRRHWHRRAPVVAQIARDLGILTVAVVTAVHVRRPQADAAAERGIEELSRACRFADHHPQREADRCWAATDHACRCLQCQRRAVGAVQGIADLITRPARSTSTSPTCAPCHVRNGHRDDGQRRRASGGDRAQAAARGPAQPAAG